MADHPDRTLTRVWDGTWVALEAGRAADLLAGQLAAGATLPGWPAVVGVAREITVGPHRFGLEVVLSGGVRAIIGVKSLSRAVARTAPLSATPAARGVAQLACEVTPTTIGLDTALPIRDRDPAALGALYLDSHIELTLPSGTVTIRPRPDGRTPGMLPPGLPTGLRTLHVITACNPYSAALSAARNTDRNRLLVAALARRGLTAIPALGRSPDGRWQEPGYAVADGDVEEVLALARRFEQHAVYELSPHHLAVRWTDPHLACPRHGWEFDTTG